MTKHSFTFEHYENILRQINASDYCPRTFIDGTPDVKSIYIRHDIDHDINAAHRMASIEQKCGVEATYLVLLRTKNYNIFEADCLAKVRDIYDMGHDVGLHFSLNDHPDKNECHDLSQLIVDDINHLSACLGIPIRVFGFHNPEKGTDFKIDVPGYINTYAPRYFDDAEYMSDSGFSWKGDDPSERIHKFVNGVIQLLVHPHNFSQDFTSDHEKISHLIKSMARTLATYNTDQCRSFWYDEFDINEFIGGIKFDE